MMGTGIARIYTGICPGQSATDRPGTVRLEQSGDRLCTQGPLMAQANASAIEQDSWLIRELQGFFPKTHLNDERNISPDGSLYDARSSLFVGECACKSAQFTKSGESSQL